MKSWEKPDLVDLSLKATTTSDCQNFELDVAKLPLPLCEGPIHIPSKKELLQMGYDTLCCLCKHAKSKLVSGLIKLVCEVTDNPNRFSC